MRTLETHKTNECNEAITITADEPDSEYGNASHSYTMEFRDTEGRQVMVGVDFQRGPIKEVGVNGVTNEALLALLIDRMEGFQSGQFACETNAYALSGLRLAMDAFKLRTKQRVARGVEGTNVV